MYALKYGTVPVVRATGGLEDTIVQFDPKKKEGNGFKFGPYDPQSLLSAVQDAVDLYKDTGAWKRLRANEMRADFSWDRSASKYMDIYRSILKNRRKGPSK